MAIKTEFKRYILILSCDIVLVYTGGRVYKITFTIIMVLNPTSVIDAFPGRHLSVSNLGI